VYAKEVREQLLLGAKVLILRRPSLTTLELFGVIAVVDAIDLASNLRLRCVQSRETPIEHLS
jgi:hypothetical protein